jgi:hypothetical protein
MSSFSKPSAHLKIPKSSVAVEEYRCSGSAQLRNLQLQIFVLQGIVLGLQRCHLFAQRLHLGLPSQTQSARGELKVVDRLILQFDYEGQVAGSASRRLLCWNCSSMPDCATPPNQPSNNQSHNYLLFKYVMLQNSLSLLRFSDNNL